jgi:hypothetical protein
MDYTQTEALQLLVENSPIAICDGFRIGNVLFFENCFRSWLTSQGIGGRATVEDNLYEREDFDLSSYKTIVFNSQGDKSTQSSFEKIVKSFSKDNLKLVIIGSDKSYFRVKDMADKLGIQLIGFDHSIPMGIYTKMLESVQRAQIKVTVTLNDVWEMDEEDLPGLFFNPKLKFG